MALALSRIIFLLGSLSLTSTSPFVDSQTAQSLSIELDPQGIISGCCLPAFHDAACLELSSYVVATTTQVLELYGLSPSNLVISDVVLVNSLSCTRRVRYLRRDGDEDQLRESVQRAAYTSGSTCSACTSNSCSAYCSGCYLCSSDRRNLEERDMQLLSGVLFGILGVTIEILEAAVAAVANGITPYFVDWLTTGAGAVLADGCMGIPSQIQIIVSLE